VISFSMGGAWSSGYRFLASRAAGHAIILIGLGVLAPFLLQYAILGSLATMSPEMIGQTALGAGLAGGTMLLLAMAIGYALQTASYFGSWRLGLGAQKSLAGPLLYGVLAGLFAVVLILMVGILAAWAARQFGSSGVAFLAILAFLIPVIAVFALFYTLLAALVGAALGLVLCVAMAYGAATGQLGLAATLVGGSGAVAVLLVVLSAVLIWLAARLSCTTCVMAERKSLNLVAAVRESWHLTFEEQWAITRYLALIGVGLALLILAGATVAGATATAFLEEAGPQFETGAALLKLAAAVPFAFLSVMVPAGIYREVAGSTMAAEVFA